MAESASVRVLCRFRPINSRERKEFIEAGKDPEQMICKFVDEANVDIELEGGLGTKKYCLDRIYPPGTPQRDVYNLAANDTVKQILQGYNGTILSYGQTGAGKSFSMFGSDVNDDEMKGIIPRAADHIFNHILHCDNKDLEFSIKCSFLEIYNESVNDLLARGEEHENLKIRESPDRGIYVENAVETYVCSPEDIITVINIGDSNRAVSATSMNPVSSRSHTVILILVGQTNKNDKSKQEGKLCLVDLAGSEKIGKTGVVGDRLKEAQNINASLTALGMCIKCLAEQSEGKATGHIPFRDSKLTRLLYESLGGNSKTTLLIACSPHPFNRDETISTLEFGKRAKCIKNKVKVNATKSVKELMAIIDKLYIYIAGYKRFIEMQQAVIDWYKGKFGLPDGVYMPTETDLLKLQAGKKISNDGTEQAGEPGNNATGEEMDAALAGGDINDASIRIASLISQLEKEQEAKYLMKQNYEADIYDLERKLKEALARGGAGNESSDEYYYSDEESDDYTLHIKELQSEIATLKKQILIYQGVDVSALAAEPTINFASLKVDFYAKPMVDYKQLDELTKQLEDEKLRNQYLEDELDNAMDDAEAAKKELYDKINVLKQENNRLRGVEAEEDNTTYSGDERDRIIKEMDAEGAKLKQMISSLKTENQKARMHSQRAELATERYLKAKQDMTVIYQKISSQEVQQKEKSGELMSAQRDSQMKQTEIDLLKDRLKTYDERIRHLYDYINEQAYAVQKLKSDKQVAIKEKEEELRKVKADFEVYKTKMYENLVQKNRIYKPIYSQSVAQQLAYQNPDILERLKNLKQGWLTYID